ncbi:AAA family ATPase [Leptolyngbya cf. ectocarpi LEGE 11479]|uniref:AAA family ATPase n=1 Tax=Leptolyngbya cf. ectocarpi LEGE 11479 TaxID=1828722 RepID=A0A928X1Q8_LEPEC|nr:BTAD domain-containing putative transcriptional regulator [Leptolyngbya ectocarpi]MBE9066201.1 AAA family ATPase [Leptolyngbya cf. ectocarpi LEGE 11479]
MGTQLLKVSLLGGFRLVQEGEGVIELRLRSQHLLAYLILHRHAPQSRHRIAAHLWPDSLDSQARTNLRKELHYLRQTYPTIEHLIVITKQTLHWHPQIRCDVDLDIFETSLAADAADSGTVHALETAIQAYQGDLWPDCDADWLYPEQERLRKAYSYALAQLTRQLQTRGEISKAIEMGQQWLNAEPLEEGAYQTLMTLYGKRGDRATALQLYHQCMTTLQTELGVNPSPTTAGIYQQLLLADEIAEDTVEAIPKTTTGSIIPVQLSPSLSPSPPTPKAENPMVGRDQLFSVLEQWLLSPLEEPTPLLLLTGEPGIGKTRLLEALVDRAIHYGWQICWGSAFAAEQLRSYGVWIDLLRAANLSDLLPGLEDTSSDLKNRGQLLDAMVQGLAQVASSERPLLLLFDDIHWLDEASTALLHYVFRLMGQGPLRIVCASRQQELQENTAVLTLITSLRRAKRLQEVAVPPLSANAISCLVKPLLDSEISGDLAPPLNAQKIYGDSGGNPLFALEVARASTEATSDLYGLIDDRLQRLDGAARDLLPWAAALGRRFNSETLALAASYPPMQFLLALEQLEQQQIVQPVHSVSSTSFDEQGSYDFVHDLVRQGAYAQLSLPRRRIIHGQLAKTLDAQTVEDDLASQVAYHAGLAGNHALAAKASVTAANRSLQLFAYTDVIQLVNQGLEHCHYLPSCDRILYSAQLLRTRVLAGVSTSEATTVEAQIQQQLSDLVGLNLAEAEAAARQALAFLKYAQGKLTDVHQHCLDAVDVLPPTPHLQAESLAANGCCLAEIEKDMDRAETILLEAQSLASPLGESISDIDLGLGCIYRYRGDYDLACQHLKTALQVSQSHTLNQRDQLNESYCLNNLAMTSWDSHQPEPSYAQALLKLAPNLPKGSDAAFAEALIALHTYRNTSDKQTQTALTETLTQLDQLDAQRKRGFIASHGTEIALRQDDGATAFTYARMTHQAANIVEHPNDIAVANALCVLSACRLNDDEAVQLYRQSLQTLSSKNLSARAQRLIDQAKQTLKQWENGTIAEILSS